MGLRNTVAAVLVAATIAVAGFGVAQSVPSAAHASAAPPQGEAVYIRNLAPRYISNKSILNALPAWQAAANNEFAQAWHTTHVHLVFIGRNAAPKGGIVATFVKDGPVKGALAFHSVTNGAPSITVYAGTGDYYGYSNGVSFTHELFELLADPEISITNQGWPSTVVTLLPSYRQLTQAPGTIWANEVCDPVEAYFYTRKGADGSPVWISDFITPNWFNDQVNGGFDYMQLVQQPFTITKGGYAQYYDPSLGWQAILNFRGTGRDADGFYKAESGRRS